MGLTRRSDSKTVFLAVKHYCLWQELKGPVEGSTEVTVTNPETKDVLKKHGFVHDSVEGNAVKLEHYKREYGAKKYVGFKLHLKDGPDSFVLDLPYQSQFLRRFLKVAPLINWALPLSITVFKGKAEGGKDPETAVWFRQAGLTIKNYFTKENPRGMPQAKQDSVSGEWDFREQHRWLVLRLMDDTIPAIAEAARRFAPPVPPAEPTLEDELQQQPDYDTRSNHIPPSEGITDDDVPF